MAQLLPCDYTGCGLPADVIVSRTADGTTLAWCDPHYLELCRAIVDATAEAEAAATAAEAAARLAATDPPEPFPSSGESSDVGDPPAEPASKPARRPRRAAVASGTGPTPDGRPGPSWTGTDDPGAVD